MSTRKEKSAAGIAPPVSNPSKAAPTIILPRSAERPAYFCRICGMGFYADEEVRWVRHCRDCAKANRDELEAQAHEALHNPIIPVFDPEAADFARKHGGFNYRPGEKPAH